MPRKAAYQEHGSSTSLQTGRAEPVDSVPAGCFGPSRAAQIKGELQRLTNQLQEAEAKAAAAEAAAQKRDGAAEELQIRLCAAEEQSKLLQSKLDASSTRIAASEAALEALREAEQVHLAKCAELEEQHAGAAAKSGQLKAAEEEISALDAALLELKENASKQSASALQQLQDLTLARDNALKVAEERLEGLQQAAAQQEAVEKELQKAQRGLKAANEQAYIDTARLDELCGQLSMAQSMDTTGVCQRAALKSTWHALTLKMAACLVHRFSCLLCMKHNLSKTASTWWMLQ